MADNGDGLIRELSAPIFASTAWMKLLAVLAVVYGALLALSIVGLLVAWLPIWIGVVLYQSARAAEQAHRAGDKASLLRALSKLKIYFTITGVLALIGLIFSALTLLGGLWGTGAPMLP